MSQLGEQISKRRTFAIISHPDAGKTTLTEKLLTYALGRGVDYIDAPTVRAITKAAAEDEYRLTSLILGVVKSSSFQMRRSQS